jgi:hypothetical protein
MTLAWNEALQYTFVQALNPGIEQTNIKRKKPKVKDLPMPNRKHNEVRHNPAT